MTRRAGDRPVWRVGDRVRIVSTGRVGEVVRIVGRGLVALRLENGEVSPYYHPNSVENE